MHNYRVTIVIPTFNRPELLPRALRSALSQTVPAKVIIADDGDTSCTAAYLAVHHFKELQSGQVRHLKTGAKTAWPNWRAGAQAADTDYVAWLQDDDIVAAKYAENIARSLDDFPDANLWMAQLHCAINETLSFWYSGNGPWMPMDWQEGKRTHCQQGSIITSSSYFASWALSPAQAYRNNDAFRQALSEVPDDCELFVERLMPALVTRGGPFVCEPMIAGYWVQHKGQLSLKQQSEQNDHIVRMLGVLDRLMPALPNWENDLFGWCDLIPTQQLANFVQSLAHTFADGRNSPYKKAIGGVLREAIKRRIFRAKDSPIKLTLWERMRMLFPRKAAA
jgi:Glycosyl transferase family 2